MSMSSQTDPASMSNVSYFRFHHLYHLRKAVVVFTCFLRGCCEFLRLFHAGGLVLLSTGHWVPVHRTWPGAKRQSGGDCRAQGVWKVHMATYVDCASWTAWITVIWCMSLNRKSGRFKVSLRCCSWLYKAISKLLGEVVMVSVTDPT